MYTGSAARIYNPRPDPAERGPPKRVTRDESHIGEMVAASKKRISWKFTLGEADAVHEIVLVHSIMSYKKVVEFDGRQMHYSATFTPGDWKFMMILEGSNHAFEVRINDLESADVPKYGVLTRALWCVAVDLAVDRIPYRHWDVYRRLKQSAASSAYAMPNMQQQQQPQTSTFGTQRWGPSGMSAQPPIEPAGRQYSHRSGAGAQGRSPEARSSSFGNPRDSGGNRGSFGNAPLPYQQQQQQHRQSGPYAGASPQNVQSSPAAPAPVQPKPKKQQEINLIDDFGPSVSVPAQSLIFDPLAGSTFAAQTGAIPPQQQQQLNNARTSSSPAFTPPYNAQIQPNPAPYVDPFASAPQAAPLKPTPAPINFNQFVASGDAYQQQQQQQQQLQQQRPSQNGAMYHATNFQQQPQMSGFQQQQQPQMGGFQHQQPQMGNFQQQQVGMQAGVGISNGGRMMPGAQQQVPVNMNMPVNYNISQMMNPVDVNNFQQQNRPAKSINIDAFAGMS